VLHDVQVGCQTKDQAIVHLMMKEPEQAVAAEEPYLHQDGSHIHLFYRLKNPSQFKTQLKFWTDFWKSGRVQVDIMHGSIAQACRYLMEEHHIGDPGYDPDPYFWPTRAIAVSPVEYANAWELWWLQMPNDMMLQYSSNFMEHYLEGRRRSDLMRTPGRVQA